MRLLISWIGDNDIAVARGEGNGDGPIGDFLGVKAQDKVLLLGGRPEPDGEVAQWIATRFGVEAGVCPVVMQSPHDFDEVYEQTRNALLSAPDASSPATEVSYLLSSGTKPMVSALLILACTYLPGALYFNMWDPTRPDPADRLHRVRWPEQFSLALWASRPAATDTAYVIGANAKVLSQDRAVMRVYNDAARAAPDLCRVLILGETGSGKEELAAFIHERSRRADKPLVSVNCGAIPDSLADSTLFGHERGAFTGATELHIGLLESANRATVFLDEIGELPLHTQSRLLRFLENGEIRRVGSTDTVQVDVRVIAATHRDLRAMVADGEFRQDLYFRLAEYVLTLPSLRDRRDDLQFITTQILESLPKSRFTVFRIEEKAWSRLRRHAWPGNVRELRNVLTRCAIDAEDAGNGIGLIRAATVNRVINEQGLLPTMMSEDGAKASAWDDIGDRLMALMTEHDLSLVDAVPRIKAAAIRSARRTTATDVAASRALGFAKPQALSNLRRSLKTKGIDT